MAIEIITDFRILMNLAWKMGNAEKSGDIELYEKAKLEHDAYRDLCLRSNKMNIGLYSGDVS